MLPLTVKTWFMHFLYRVKSRNQEFLLSISVPAPGCDIYFSPVTPMVLENAVNKYWTVDTWFTLFLLFLFLLGMTYNGSIVQAIGFIVSEPHLSSSFWLLFWWALWGSSSPLALLAAPPAQSEAAPGARRVPHTPSQASGDPGQESWGHSSGASTAQGGESN